MHEELLKKALTGKHQAANFHLEEEGDHLLLLNHTDRWGTRCMAVFMQATVTIDEIRKIADKHLHILETKPYRDWCPLCGRRFYGDTVEEVFEEILGHMNDGSCEKNFRPIEEALADDHF